MKKADRKQGIPDTAGQNRKPGLRTAAILAALAVAAAATAVLVFRPCRPAAEKGVTVFLDGSPWRKGDPLPGNGGELKVLITLDGGLLMELPFGEKHTVRIVRPDGGENTVFLTGRAVTMAEANCEGQDCVQMGEVTPENLETRVMGGFIVCLPHRLSVEVRSDR